MDTVRWLFPSVSFGKKTDKVTKAEIEALFKEVREGFHSDYDIEFNKYYSNEEREKFDTNAATWLTFEHFVLSRSDVENILDGIVWEELAALKTDCMYKKIHKHKMIKENLLTLRQIVEGKCAKVDHQSKEPKLIEALGAVIVLLCVAFVLIVLSASV